MFSKKTKILIVDDTSVARRMVEFSLKKLGFLDLMFADDGRTALDIITTQAANLDPVGLVICDWMMPHQTGKELLQQAQEKDSAPPFIFITVKQGDQDRQQILQAGASSILGKPFKSDELGKALQKAYVETSGVKGK